MTDLPARQRAALEAVRRLTAEPDVWVTARQVAEELGLPGGPRQISPTGKGARSGEYAPSLRVASVLRALERRGLLRSKLSDGQLARAYRP